ncbi:hypothetical protein [Jiella sp. M17.18]|uniref:hypothetical protein n=1 Tax=Jiella sp. M17.18 TaxID=3234247 RepID=UPI0034DFE468
MKSLLALLAVAALAGCTSTSTAVRYSSAAPRPVSAEKECARFGFVAGTAAYNSCVIDMQKQAVTLARGRH